MPTPSGHAIAVSYHGRCAVAVMAISAASQKEKAVARIFNLVEMTQIAEFPLLHEGYLGERLAILDDKRCFAGCYNAHGLAAYSLPNGEELWRRKDLKAVQRVTASEAQELVFCGREGAAHILNAKTGETVEKLRAVRTICWSPFDETVLVDSKHLEIHRPFGKKIGTIPRERKSVNGCCFSRDHVVVLETDMHARCYRLTDLNMTWANTGTGLTWVSCGFHEKENCFLTFHNRPISGRTEHWLLYLNPNIWEIVRSIRCDHTGQFCRRGEARLSTHLCYSSNKDGKLLRDFTTDEILSTDPKYKDSLLDRLARSNRSPQELEEYMRAEGFGEKDIARALWTKTSNDKQPPN